jgi:seryl-tRNA synthetase
MLGLGRLDELEAGKVMGRSDPIFSPLSAPSRLSHALHDFALDKRSAMGLTECIAPRLTTLRVPPEVDDQHHLTGRGAT